MAKKAVKPHITNCISWIYPLFFYINILPVFKHPLFQEIKLSIFTSDFYSIPLMPSCQKSIFLKFHQNTSGDQHFKDRSEM